ncbi:MAG TPA: hypothetical protein VMU78_10045 [Methylocella sp.]|nr:hypothetical protein [Methylocella sp.]
MTKKSIEELNDEKIAPRRDDVIKRMINTPPQPHKPIWKKKAAAAKSKQSSETKKGSALEPSPRS